MKTKLRILHLEDDPRDAELIREVLESVGFVVEIEVVQTEADYVAQLDQGWDLILADYSLPQFDGLQALELLKEKGVGTSLVIVSGTMGEEAAVTAMRAGASDYVMKDHLGRLGPAVERAVQETIERDERRQVNVCRQLVVTVLEIINRIPEPPHMIQEIIDATQQATGCDAIGIRMQSGEDFPYLAETGFSADFLQTESSLLVHAPDGGLCRNADGTLSLACTCGLVLSGKVDRANPHVTHGGSFWTNNSLALLDLPADEDPRLHPRNRCMHEGYLSLALIPISTQGGIVGLLQLNGRKQDCFTLAAIEALEGIASHIGEMLMRRLREKQLKQSNLALQSSVVELRSAQDQLVRQERLSALGQMASGITHDFNNVLMPILGCSEILMNEPDALDDRKETIQMLDGIYQAGLQARQIVRRLSEFYKGGAKIEVEPVDVATLVKLVVELTKPKWKVEAEGAGKKVQIETILRDLPLIEAENLSLRDMLTNLIFNAVDAMPHGGTITISGKRVGESVELVFRDTGEGMTPDVQRRCLEPFFSTKGACGSGQGLTMVATIVKRHKGSITVESEAGKGTTFTITLPINPPDSVRKEEKTVTLLPVPKLRILAVDDEAVVLKLLVRILSKDGHTVDTAQSGREGIKLASAGVYDLYILDRGLGDMSGDQLALEIKRLHPAVPVIQFTGFALEARVKPGALSGVDAVLDKPATRQALRQVISEVIHRKEAPNDSETDR